jgi:Ser/Thr protein kinase RdoA (MazF antagonist)
MIRRVGLEAKTGCELKPDLPPWVGSWCRTVLGAEPVEVLFRVSQLSEVVGVRLADGREVVVKRRADELGRAGRCVTAQRLLAEQGFPCPMPLTDVIVSDGVAVHAERFVRGGELETKDTPEAGSKSGRLLADLVRRLAALDLEPPLPNPEWVRWDAMPQREAAAAVPAWIEDTIRRVQAKLVGCDLPPVLGHADWQAQNIRWRHGEPHAVYDWDGLAWLPEAVIAGSAAGIFAIHRKQPTPAPLESSEAFLHAYESERGACFSPYETEIAWAASIWEALHNARDELVENQPKLSYERLKAERVERLTRANAG